VEDLPRLSLRPAARGHRLLYGNTTVDAELDKEDYVIIHEDEEPMPAAGPLWTDDFSSLFEVVEFNN
jgi:hypothetical protein